MAFVTRGLQIIADERHKQIVAHGYDAEHDDAYINSELVGAAVSYAVCADLKQPILETLGGRPCPAPTTWPWGDADWKPDAPIAMLAKAGALISAEIDRLLRAEERKETA
ncbi:MAG: hypothetical protein ACYDGM_12325 [Vulcanimicrobiaceae bacterium]